MGGAGPVPGPESPSAGALRSVLALAPATTAPFLPLRRDTYGVHGESVAHRRGEGMRNARGTKRRGEEWSGEEGKGEQI